VGKVVPFRSDDPPPGKVAVYLWQIDSNFKPEHGGRAWEVVGWSEPCEWPQGRV
jgi:hypothetical protein